MRSHTFWPECDLIDTLLFKVWLVWIKFCNERNYLIHFFGLPLSEWADHVWYSSLRTDLPCFFNFFHLIVIVTFDLWVTFLGDHTDSRVPNEYCDTILTTDPAFIFLACIDSPLCTARHNFFMSKLPLDNTLRSFETRHHLLLDIV